MREGAGSGGTQARGQSQATNAGHSAGRCRDAGREEDHTGGDYGSDEECGADSVSVGEFCPDMS